MSWLLIIWGILMLLVVATIIIIGLALAHADSLDSCIKYESAHMAKVQSENGGGCEWVIDQYLAKGFRITDYEPIPMNGHGACGCDIYILVK